MLSHQMFGNKVKESEVFAEQVVFLAFFNFLFGCVECIYTCV